MLSASRKRSLKGCCVFLPRRRARELRNHPTDAELAIWHKIAYFRPRFTRQLVVERYIVDLACGRCGWR